MFRSSNFDKTLDNACSHLRLEPEWPSIMLICDLIRQNDATPKQAIQAIKKKLLSPNPHTAFYSLLVLESVMKNCGAPVHDEVATKENCETFSQLIESTPHENVKAKMLELIQAWAYAFRTSEKYQAIKDTMTILKTKGHTFPELKEADAMFTSDTAPSWHDGKCCHHCRVEFSFTVRKHHCRNCGQIFCGQCSAKTCTLPKFGIEKEVRVCDVCFTSLQKSSGSAMLKRTSDGPNDLPAEYLNSSLAQQSQTPVRKTDQELKEEEELQLALALSQSEAEQKSHSTLGYRPSLATATYRKSNSPEHTSNAVPIAPVLRDSSPSLSPHNFEDRTTDPELAKYLNRDYWEQRNSGGSMTTVGSSNSKTVDLSTNPTAPMVTPQPTTANMSSPFKNSTEDAEIENFSANMKTQVEIFVNRMKSNSSRGRSISTDSSVQTLFLNLTAFHSRLLDYIKKADDKRMWYEQLQDKLTQIKDSRAALDVLRQEHQDKLRQLAEEQERQRQMQMAYKLELMRKKKQEYLQYQRQLALQRIQEQEREMKMHQDQQKVIYNMGVQSYGPPGVPYMSSPPAPSSNNIAVTNSSPAHNIMAMPPTGGMGVGAPIGAGGVGMPPMGSAFNPVMSSASAGMQRYTIHNPAPMYGTIGGQMHAPPVNGAPHPSQMPTMQQPSPHVPYPSQAPPGMPMNQPNMHGPHEFIAAPPQVQTIPHDEQPPQQQPPAQQPPQQPPQQPSQQPPQQTPQLKAEEHVNETSAPVQVAEAELISFD